MTKPKDKIKIILSIYYPDGNTSFENDSFESALLDLEMEQAYWNERKSNSSLNY
jgi:hypothetical protein